MSRTHDKANLTWENTGQPMASAILIHVGFFAYAWLSTSCVVPSGWWLLGGIVAWVIFSALLFLQRCSFAFAWVVFTLVFVGVAGAYVPEGSFSRDHVCHNPRTGEIFISGGGYWSHESFLDRRFDCFATRYDKWISDCGRVDGAEYEINLFVASDLVDEELQKAALLAINYHKVVQSCSGFTRRVPEGADKIEKNSRVVELGRQMDKCAAAVWDEYDDSVANIAIKSQPSATACDFSTFGLTFENLRIRREVDD